MTTLIHHSEGMLTQSETPRALVHERERYSTVVTLKCSVVQIACDASNFVFWCMMSDDPEMTSNVTVFVAEKELFAS